MAAAIARQGISNLSSCGWRSRTSTKGTCLPSGSSAATAASGGRVGGPHLFAVCSIHSRAPQVEVSSSSPSSSLSFCSNSSTSRPGFRGWSSEANNGGEGGRFDDAAGLLATASVLPKLVVMDLDFTIWPFYCYNRRVSERGAPPALYPQVVDIVKALAARQVPMAIASRAPSSVARAFLDQFSIVKHFHVMEIYFTFYSKSTHFAALQKKTGIPYNSMLFFDDEVKNINTASKLGVASVLVTEGLDLKALEEGLKAVAFRNR